MSLLFIDFETRSRADLTRIGGWRYAEDPTSEVLCGVALDTRFDPAVVYVWTPFEVPLTGWHLDPRYLAQLNTPPDAVVYAEPLLGSDLPPPPVLAAAAEGVPFVGHNAYGFDEVILAELGVDAVWLDSLPRARRQLAEAMEPGDRGAAVKAEEPAAPARVRDEGGVTWSVTLPAS